MITIRELSAVDSVAYQTLMLRAFNSHPESFRIAIEDAGEPMVPFATGGTGTFTLGAWLMQDQLIGVVSFERDTRAKFKHKGLLYRMYVRADLSGKGTGRKLMQAAIKRVRQIEGLEQINLTVIASNVRAKRLYESEGFKSYALEARALKMGEVYYDEEQMVLALFKK